MHPLQRKALFHHVSVFTSPLIEVVMIMQCSDATSMTLVLTHLAFTFTVFDQPDLHVLAVPRYIGTFHPALRSVPVEPLNFGKMHQDNSILRLRPH